MPFDIVTIGLLHTGEKGNPMVYASRLQEAFPDCNGLSLRRDRWIPVSERVPETTDLVLVYNGYTVACGGCHKGSWSWAESDDACQPTHWMPLPEPPT